MRRALAFGAGVSGFRIAFGAHFLSDVIFAGVFTFLIIWLVHGLIYRWRATRLTDEQVERAIERIVLPGYEAIERIFLRKPGAGEAPIASLPARRLRRARIPPIVRAIFP